MNKYPCQIVINCYLVRILLQKQLGLNFSLIVIFCVCIQGSKTLTSGEYFTWCGQRSALEGSNTKKMFVTSTVGENIIATTKIRNKYVAI